MPQSKPAMDFMAFSACSRKLVDLFMLFTNSFALFLRGTEDASILMIASA